jgi:hypothetical protein
MIGGVVANQYDGRRRLGSFDRDRNLWNAGRRRLVHEDLPTVGAVLFFVRNATDVLDILIPQSRYLSIL